MKICPNGHKLGNEDFPDNFECCPMCASKLVSKSENLICKKCGFQLEPDWQCCPSCQSPVAYEEEEDDGDATDEYYDEKEDYEETEETDYQEIVNNALQKIFGENALANDFPAAFTQLLEAAQAGFEEAFYWVGLCYYNGYGTDQDEYQAREWFEKAVVSKNYTEYYVVRSKYHLSDMLIYENPQRAFRLCNEAASAGYDPAKLNLGSCYFQGIGVDVNYSKAYQYIHEAYLKNIDGASRCEAICLMDGKGVQQNLEEALKICLENRGNGDYEYDYLAGLCLCNLNRRQEGMDMIRIAANNGVEKAIRELEQINSSSSPIKDFARGFFNSLLG